MARMVTRQAKVLLKLKTAKSKVGYVVRSESHVQDALDDLAALDDEMEALIAPLRVEYDALNAAIDKYMLKRPAGTKVESERVNISVVQSHKRWWDTDKLKDLVPRHVYKNITYLEVDKDALDNAVRAGEITREQIQDAFMEKPNTPYVKRTPVGSARDGQAEADSLAAAAG